MAAVCAPRRKSWLLSILAAPAALAVVSSSVHGAEVEDSVCLLQTSSNTAAKPLAPNKEVEEEEFVRKHMGLSFNDGEDCPTSYIYDIPELWDLDRPLKDIPKLGEKVLDDLWGEYLPCGDGNFHLNQYTMPSIVLYRVLTSKRCRVTSNPEEADLFIVPYLNQPKRLEEYCTEKFIDPEPRLVHLNEKTAHKHIFLLGKGHLLLSHCGVWWRRPTGLLSRSIRVAYSMPSRDPEIVSNFGTYGPPDGRELTLAHLAKLMGDFDRDDVDFPHTFSVPYPATGLLGAGREEPWRDYTSERPLLSYFFGGVHGRYGLEVRQRLVADCEKAGPPTCLHRAGTMNPCLAMGRKKQAYFCLEPGGDSPYRKSLYDDLSLGCVPVLFSPYMQLVSPWHWGHFRNSSHVYINYADYMEGKIDLFQTLKEIAASPRLAEMRKSIAEHAHAVQYSRTDYPGDAVERLLIGAHHAAKDHEAKQAAAELAMMSEATETVEAAETSKTSKTSRKSQHAKGAKGWKRSKHHQRAHQQKAHHQG